MRAVRERMESFMVAVVNKGFVEAPDTVCEEICRIQSRNRERRRKPGRSFSSLLHYRKALALALTG